MSDIFQEPDDATPLAHAERDGLVQTWITNRNDLNKAERENVAAGIAWAGRRRNLTLADLLTDEFVKTLHKQMFSEVWRWAGSYRQTERNLGVHPARISPDMAAMFDDIKYWIEHATYTPDEIAVRFHQQLTFIHPFPNGNGRFARLMADLLIERLEGEIFSWGGGSLAESGEERTRYIAALKAGDNQDFVPLLTFVRS